MNDDSQDSTAKMLIGHHDSTEYFCGQGHDMKVDCTIILQLEEDRHPLFSRRSLVRFFYLFIFGFEYEYMNE